MISVNKIIFLLAAVLVVAAVPFKSTRDDSKEHKKFMAQQLNHLSMFAQADRSSMNKKYEVLMKSSEKENINQLNTRTFRLPNNTIPLHYDIDLSTNVHSADFAFHGGVRINIRVLKLSSTITLHTSQMQVQSINLLNSEGGNIQRDLPFAIDSFLQFLQITANKQLQVDQELIVEVIYTGVLRNDRLGFYRTSYRDLSTRQTFWVATTLFEPTHARHAFPCYDEIRYRTTFDVQITHHQSYNALSNMPVAQTTNNGDFVTTKFDTTPAMPTYNVAFTVSNFDFVSNNNEDLPMKVYAQPSAIADGQADNALELSEKMLKTMEEVFRVPYPLPKSDLVAVNNWRNGESWGLVKIDAVTLLNPTRQRRRELQIAHEYSHTYFSNLVSPSDWRYLWLNEGFATLYENIINDLVFPEKNLWEEFFSNFYDVVVDNDSIGRLDPLNRYVESPTEIARKFDLTTYNKGALILKMLKDALTEEVFLAGVKNYLNEMQFKSASPEDLYAGLQTAYDEAFPGNDINITELMQTWTNSRGLPIVTVSRSENGLLLTQQGLATDELFSIPITYATASNQDFDNVAAKFWMNTKELEITRENAGKNWTDDDWIIFNLRDSGYYLINYDENLWGLITSSLANDHEAIHFYNRGSLFADTYRFIQQAIDFRATIFLEMMDSLKLEFHPNVWRRANLGMRTFESRTRGSELHGMYLNFLHNIMSEIYGRKFENSRYASEHLNFHSCVSGVQACVDDALRALLEHMETGSTSFPFSYRCHAFRVANETVWMHYFNFAMAQEEGRFRDTALNDLECTQNPELIKHFLDTATNMTNVLTSDERQRMLRAMSRRHIKGYEAVIELIEERHEIVNRIASTALQNLIVILAENTNLECQAEKVLDLIPFIPQTPGNERWNREFYRNLMEPNLRFVSRNSEDLHSWLERYEVDKKVATEKEMN